MLFKSANPALIIIDVQKAIDHPEWGLRNNPDAEQNIAKLLQQWRVRQLPVFHVRHSSTEQDSTYRPDQPGFAFKPEAMPLEHETIITKHVNCAFIRTDLEQQLHAAGVRELVIVGVITNNSVDVTVRIAANLGFDVFVPEDATATFGLTARNGVFCAADMVHAVFLANLSDEYARIVDTKTVLKSIT
jgi:nicotinamidase-related amidase